MGGKAVQHHAFITSAPSWMICQLRNTDALALGKKARYEVNVRYGGRGVDDEEVINIVHLPGFEPQFLGRPERSLVTALTELSCFHFSVMSNKHRHFTLSMSLLNVLLTSLK